MARSLPRNLALSSALAALALALLAGPAAAAPREIAYVCKGLDICLLDPDNPGDVVNLTDDEATSFEEDPAWSPDGNRLAFVARFTGRNEENVYTMEPGATGNQANIAVQVTHFGNGMVPTGEIAWSPDGSKIAFRRGPDPGDSPLFVANSDGSSANAVEIAHEGGGPTWAPDSAKIAFWHENQIYLTNPDDSVAPVPLAGAAGQEPAWSPDGSRIAFGHAHFSGGFVEMQIVAAGGGTPLTIPGSTQFAFDSWSPSGAQLAYHETLGETTYFRIVNADGSGNHGLPIVQGLNANGPAPSWSPDGSRLVFQGYYFGGPGPSTNEVYVANADGSGAVTPLTPDQGFSTSPAWRPNPVSQPGPQVFTPSQGGSATPLPGPTVKPTTVWFTNRIPWTPGPPFVPMMSVGCSAPSCNVSGVGKTKGAVPAGLVARPALAATASGRAKRPKKSGALVVARGKVQVPLNQKRTLRLKLTKLAIAVLEKVGKLKMTVTVTIAPAGQVPLVEARTVEVFLKPAKPKH